MSAKLLLAAYRLLFAALVLVAVTVQFVHGMYSTNFNAVNFLSFFTIESNVFGLVMFAIAAKALLTGRHDRLLDYLRGAATLYMVVTGIVYAVALAGADVQTPIPWVNAVLHYVFPIAILIDWLIDRPVRLSLRKTLLWLLFPVVYLAYSLIRGAVVHWYPYPFVNVAQYGYLRVSINSAAIAVVAFILTLLIAIVPRLMGKHTI